MADFHDTLRNMKKLVKYLLWVLIVVSIVGVIASTISELIGISNYITGKAPYTVSNAIEGIGIVSSLALSAALVALYDKQANIQSNQTDILENEHEPKIEVVSARFPTDSEDYQTGIVFEMANSGKGTAVNIRAQTDVVIDSNISVNIIPKEEEISREADGISAHNDGFYTGGNYLSPQENQTEFGYADKIDARETGEGTKTVDNTRPHLLYYMFARVKDDSLPLLKTDSEEDYKKVKEALDFDRMRLKYTIFYEDIDGNEYSEASIDYLVPIMHNTSPSKIMEIGMEYSTYKERKMMPVYQRSGNDPLEEQMKYYSEEKNTTVFVSDHT